MVTIYNRDVFGKQVIFSWWHGKGGLLDYTNKEAVEWWHSQMDEVYCVPIHCILYTYHMLGTKIWYRWVEM